MKSSFGQLLVRWIILAVGVLIATRLVDGIHCADLGALVVAVLLLSFLNAILRPVLLLFTLPFIMVTLGLGVVVINAILFLFVGHIVDGFRVDGFGPAFWGSIVVSLTNLFANVLIRTKVHRVPPPPPPPRRGPGPGGDIIDI